MNFAIDDDVVDLVASVADFFDRRGDADAIAAATTAGNQFDQERWRALCAMGLPMLLVPEPDGVGADLLAAATLVECIGAVLLPEPVIASMVLAAACASEPRTSALAESLCDGTRVAAWSGGDAALAKSGSLSGVVSVAHLDDIDAMAFLAADEYTSGAALVIVDATEISGRVGTSDLDPTRPTAIIDLATVEATEVIRLTDPAGQRIAHGLVVLTAAELVGGMQKVLEHTTEFVKTRQQFGRPIGSFQAIKHRLADMYALTEQARALVQFAALTSQEDPGAAPAVIGSVARWVPRSAIQVAEDGVHLHGAMGYSWEVDAHLHLRRAWATRAILRDFDARSPDDVQERTEAAS